MIKITNQDWFGFKFSRISSRPHLQFWIEGNTPTPPSIPLPAQNKGAACNCASSSCPSKVESHSRPVSNSAATESARWVTTTLSKSLGHPKRLISNSRFKGCALWLRVLNPGIRTPFRLRPGPGAIIVFKTQFSTYSTDVAIEPKMRKMIVMYLRVLGVGKKKHTHTI